MSEIAQTHQNLAPLSVSRSERGLTEAAAAGQVQWCQILLSSEASIETAFPRASWRVRVKGAVGRGDEWDALGKAVSTEAEPPSVAEPNIS